MKNQRFYQAIAFAAQLGILVVLGLSPALAQSPSTSNSTLTPAVISSPHGPMRLHRRTAEVEGSFTSDNWAGYAITGSTFTYAHGSWHVPEVRCDTTPNFEAAFWVGIDGFSDDTVEQTGITSFCHGTTPEYWAWYEFYPAGPVNLTDFPIAPGQVIGASVTYNGDGSFTVGLHNHSTGQEFSQTVVVSGAQRSSVEWITEAPEAAPSGGGLANFHVANYGDDYTGDSGTNYASDGGKAKPIAAFGDNVQEITMVSETGVTEAIPSGLTKDGTSFRVWWEAE